LSWRQRGGLDRHAGNSAVAVARHLHAPPDPVQQHVHLPGQLSLRRALRFLVAETTAGAERYED
jgi:hypothetical protein